MQKNEGIPPLQPYTKISSTWISNLHIIVTTIEPLEENIGPNLHNLLFSNRFLDMTTKIQTMNNKRKKNKLDFKIKNIYGLKDMIRKIKKQLLNIF